MDFTRRVELDCNYDDAVTRVTDALKDQGFGVLTENRRAVVEALDPKLIAEVPDNPALAPIADEAGKRIQAALDTSGTA